MNIAEIDDYDGRRIVHLPHDYAAAAGFHTLCGLCDVPESISDTEDEVTCDTCMAVMEHVLRLASSRGVIRSMPRKLSLNKARTP